NAQTVINQALEQADGGTVYLLKGTYYCTNAISILKNGATLCGDGINTDINAECDNRCIHVIADNVTIKNLQIDFTDTHAGSGQYQGAIHLNSAGDVAAEYCTIENTTISCSGHAISDAEISSSSRIGMYTRIINNTLNPGVGITAYSFRNENKFLSGNIVNNEFTDSLEV
ncbi:MAG: glycoside hydrolase family 55 protein, partial [bacterium]|nr:glycoside hydrolase family 55 protein [bacterium]